MAPGTGLWPVRTGDLLLAAPNREEALLMTTLTSDTVPLFRCAQCQTDLARTLTILLRLAS